MVRMTYAAAMIDALFSCMEADPRVSVLGNEVLGLGPQRVHLERIKRHFPDRIRFPPTSEAAYSATAIGAAMAGERVFVHLGAASFSYLAMSSIANEAATAHYTSGGTIKVPVVIHMLHGLRIGGASQHSESPQAKFWNTPGLEIVLPASPRDVKGLLISALKSDNPSVMLTHDLLIPMEGDVPEGPFEIPLGQAEVKRKGRDATVVATSHTVQIALAAGEILAREGIELEVVDPRTLVPLDQQTILDSVAKTGRLVVADETVLSCGVASEIAAIVAEKGFSSLKAPILRVTRPDVLVPASPALEAYITPTAEKIAAAVRQVMA